MRIFLFLVCGIMPFLLKSQQYEVETFYDDYVDLVDYNSVLLENGGLRNWDKRFDLNFEFPYYDNTYDHIICLYRGLCHFEDTDITTIRLASFGYETDIPRDPNRIDSDARYTLTERDGKKCLVLQWTKHRMLSDPSIEEFDSHIDMQYWFYEDGTIEIRFGHSNLNNSPTYVPGENFYRITGNQGPVPIANEITLFDAPDFDTFISYGDSSSHEDYFTSIEDRFFIHWWPPEGWVIRFTRTGVNNEEVQAQNPWNIYSSGGMVELRRQEAASARTSIQIYNSLGQVVAQEELPPGAKQYSLDASPWAQGIYFYELTSDKGDYQSGRLFVGE